MKKLVFLLLVLLLTGCDRDINGDRFQNKLDDTISQAEEINNFYGLTVSVDGEMIKETYFNRSHDERAVNVFSVTKSVNSLLVGIAIEEGFIEAVDQPISDFIDLSDYSNELNQITIKHLLTMSAGLLWDDSDLGGEMNALRSNMNPIDSILSREMGFTPGTQFNYSDGSSHLMSIILTEATGMSTHEFANEYLLNPLGIIDTVWNTDRNGVPIGGSDLQLTSVQMNTIGNLVINNGMYNGVQLVSQEWIEESTSKHIAVSGNTDYGYYWWLTELDDVKLISARGWGGQQIYVVPEYNIVVTTATNGWVRDAAANRQFGESERLVIEVIELIIKELE